MLPVGYDDEDDDDEYEDPWRGYLPEGAFHSNGRRKSIAEQFRDLRRS